MSSITLKRRQRAKMIFILALCQQSEGKGRPFPFLMVKMFASELPCLRLESALLRTLH